MGRDDGVGWLTCGEDGCIGIRLSAGSKCLAHADGPDLDAELKRLGRSGTIDARGVKISAALLDRLLAAAPRDPQQPDRPRFTKVQFDAATFQDGAMFRRAAFGHGAGFRGVTFGEQAGFDDTTFGNDARFNDATFGNDARFRRAIFADQARFDGATFGDHAWFHRAAFGERAGFRDATFGGDVRFRGAILGGQARFDGATFGDQANFDGATFGDGVGFGGATFADEARFDGAAFGDQASFRGASFGDRALFRRARFGRGVGFRGATFGDGTRFGGAAFGDRAVFDDATFEARAQFDSATFGDQAWFRGARFGYRASFEGARFGERASLASAVFGAWASFARAAFGDEASLVGAAFGGSAGVGPLLCAGRLVLDHASFGQSPTLAISADRLDCEGTKLPDGATLHLRWVEVRLEGVDFARPSVLAGVDPFAELDEDPLRRRVVRSWRTERPRVLSLRDTDVRNLTLANVDLRACRFTGAYSLDQLRLQATVDFADRPAGVKVGRAIPPLWRWTRRRTLAEEHRWRRTQAKHAGWYPRACRVRGLAKQEHSLRPAHIALLYRALRKGREDSKDEPGAADFYYGEMEMRRHDRTAPWPERVVLLLYWVSAGYALRATRALGCLLVLLAMATVLLASTGFAPAPPTAPQTATISSTPTQQRAQISAMPTMTAERPFPDRLGTAALVAVEGAVFRSSDQALTYKGRLIHAALRLVGPVLLGLALLSVRGRVNAESLGRSRAWMTAWKAPRAPAFSRSVRSCGSAR